MTATFRMSIFLIGCVLIRPAGPYDGAVDGDIVIVGLAANVGEAVSEWTGLIECRSNGERAIRPYVAELSILLHGGQSLGKIPGSLKSRRDDEFS